MDTDVKLRQNLNTDFLKLIAIVTMVIDHAGSIFFPDNIIVGILGRMAFPLFAYCIVVGCLYTRDWKKYLLRLLIFGVVSQPFFGLAFHPEWEWYWREFLALNIFFTLIAGVLAVNALMNIRKNWWMLAAAVAMELLIGLDYGIYGIGLMMIFYLCRKKSWLSLLAAVAWMIWYGGLGDFLFVGPVGLDKQFFAVLALPLIYLHTDFNVKINKYFFYVFYPAHFLVLFLVRMVLGV